MKNPVTPAGIESAIFRFVAQHLNHCATAVPLKRSSSYIYLKFSRLNRTFCQQTVLALLKILTSAIFLLQRWPAGFCNGDATCAVR